MRHHTWKRRCTQLDDLVEIVFKVKAQAYSTEAVNPRHEHEWEVWQHVELPEEKVLIPDAIDSVNIPIEPRSWYFVTRDLVGSGAVWERGFLPLPVGAGRGEGARTRAGRTQLWVL